MLSTEEIIELEKKVFKYRIKKKLILISSSITIIGILSLVYYQFQVSSLDLILPNNAEQKQISQNNQSNDAKESNITQNKQIIVTQVDKVETNVSNVPPASLYLQLPNIIDTKIQTPSFSGIKEETLNTKIVNRKSSSTEETFYRAPEDKINTALLPPQLEEIKEKSIIKIETHEVNSVQYLKDKFDKTHNIVFALALAEDYYANKNYKESNKWALIANNIDSENEKSWIIFAKSKFKLGQKEDATRALEAYLKSNKSKQIQSLLHQMTIGENID